MFTAANVGIIFDTIKLMGKKVLAGGNHPPANTYTIISTNLSIK